MMRVRNSSAPSYPARARSRSTGWRPRPVSDWYFVTFDEQLVRIQAQPPGQPAWSQEFRWDSVIRVCFKAEADMWLSDGIYVFTSHRPQSYAIPTEASGGDALRGEILRRKLFDAESRDRGRRLRRRPGLVAARTAGSEKISLCRPGERQDPSPRRQPCGNKLRDRAQPRRGVRTDGPGAADDSYSPPGLRGEVGCPDARGNPTADAVGHVLPPLRGSIASIREPSKVCRVVR